MYDARQIANWFIQKFKSEGQRLTIIKLLKLVYLAHGWHLGASKRPLIKNRIEAWKYGPVIPDMYKAFRPQGVIIDEKLEPFDIKIDNAFAIGILNYVYDNYGAMSAEELSDLTHEKGSPWDVAVEYGYFSPIANAAIFIYYRGKINAYRKVKNGG